MKRLSLPVLALLFCLCLPVHAHAAASYDELAERFERVITDEPALKKLRDDVSSAMRDSDDERLLRLRLTINQMLQDQAALLADCDLLAERNPHSPGIQLQRCMFREGVLGFGDETLACYREVVDLYKKQGTALPLNPNYIIAASLAETPDAEELRRNYVRTAGDSHIEKMNKHYFEHFTREGFISGNLPPMP